MFDMLPNVTDNEGKWM